MYERDEYVEYPVGHSLHGTAEYLRGKFPDVSTFRRTNRQMIKSVTGAFHNMTTLILPAAVSTFLSLGPKLMLPAFTLMHSEDVSSTWKSILEELTRAKYPCMNVAAVHRILREHYTAHCGDSYHVNAMDRHLLTLASITSTFLHRHRKVAALVEGDKGKVMGLLPRITFQKLCDDFISEGVSEGRYVYSTFTTEDELIDAQRKRYDRVVLPLLVYPKGEGQLLLFMPSKPVLSSSEAVRELNRMNTFVRQKLNRVCWMIPVFRPSIKYHKVPLKLRPIVSKRNTPSIRVGKVILLTLSKVM